MVHVHLKLLEKYSQQHEHMFVRSRRRQSKKAIQKTRELGEESVEREEDDAELAAASKRALSERAFDFKKFEGKYLNNNCINTFISYLGFYKELSEAQVMRAIKMLHRIFEKRKMEVLLYRLDLVDLLYQMMQGSQAMPRSHPAYKQVDQFTKHFMRKLFKKLEAEPALYVELLFTKSNSTLHYLQFGEGKEVHVSRPRAAAELHVKPSAKLSHAEQIGVAVAVLLDDNNSGEVEWLKDVLKRAFNERKAWEDEAAARRTEEGELYAEMGAPKHIYIDPGHDERKKAMFKDGHLRLLLKLVGCEPADTDETPNTKWIIPASISAEALGQNLTSLQKYANDPPVYEDGVAAADLLARKNLLPPRSRRTDALSSSESDDDADDDELLFAPGGPTPRSASHKKDKKKGTRKRRPNVDAEDALTDLQREKREKRLAAEKLKLSKIKSEMYVRDSDDEDDEEKDRLFFEREREIRRMGPRGIDDPAAPPMLNGKGRKVAFSDDEDMQEPKKRRRTESTKAKLSDPKSIFGGDDSDEQSGNASGTPAMRKSSAVVVVSSEDESENENDESGKDQDVVMIDEDEDEDEDVPVPTARRRKPVIVDSDDEE
jgi:replication fork protection complex subunit Tof1/Swi1